MAKELSSRSSSPQDRARISRFGALAFTGLSLVLAGLTGWLVLHMLSAGGYSNEPTRSVVVAAHELAAGKPLTDRDLKLIEWPSSSIPIGAFSKIAELLEPEPRVPAGGLVAGEPILRLRLASPQAGPGLAAVVAPHSRAIAIKVDKELAAARLLYPGAHVDIMATFNDPVARLVLTRTVLENVKVLAVGTFADVEAVRRGRAEDDAMRGGYSPRSEEAEAVVTFEVAPADAERISLAAHQGKIDVALRSATDLIRTEPPGITSSDLFGDPHEEPMGVTGRRAARPLRSSIQSSHPVPHRREPNARAEKAGALSAIEVIDVHTH
jgi:pilus assembly protein CpaB